MKDVLYAILATTITNLIGKNINIGILPLGELVTNSIVDDCQDFLGTHMIEFAKWIEENHWDYLGNGWRDAVTGTVLTQEQLLGFYFNEINLR